VLVGSLLGAANVPEPVRALSAREREVLALLAEGLTDHGIALRLNLSPPQETGASGHLCGASSRRPSATGAECA
jgi:hypothetical protein